MNKASIDRHAAFAELAATIPPHIKRLEAAEVELDGRARDIVRRAVDAELSLLVELQRELTGVGA
jgi:hypothetical protein